MRNFRRKEKWVSAFPGISAAHSESAFLAPYVCTYIHSRSKSLRTLLSLMCVIVHRMYEHVNRVNRLYKICLISVVRVAFKFNLKLNVNECKYLAVNLILLHRNVTVQHINTLAESLLYKIWLVFVAFNYAAYIVFNFDLKLNANFAVNLISL